MSLISEFRKFAMRGNLVDLAIGFTVGAAFSTVAKSLVDDLIMPPLGLLLGRTDFSDAFILLRAGEGATPPYASLQVAQAAGATTLNYGQFLTNVFTLFLIALAMFAVIRAVNRVSEKLNDEFGTSDETPQEQQPETKKCAYCREVVPYKASRCSHCTSFLGTEGGPLNPDARITPAT